MRQKKNTTTKGKKAGGKYTWNKKCKETKWNKYILTSEPDLIFNEFLTNLGLRTPRLQQSPLGLVWRWSLQKLLLETWSSFAASELTPGTVEASVETLQFPCISSEKICLTTYRPFWHEVTSAMLVSRNNPVGAGLVLLFQSIYRAAGHVSETLYIFKTKWIHHWFDYARKCECNQLSKLASLREISKIRVRGWPGECNWLQLRENFHSGWPDPGITIPGRLVWLSCRHKGGFCCVWITCRVN